MANPWGEKEPDWEWLKFGYLSVCFCAGLLMATDTRPSEHSFEFETFFRGVAGGFLFAIAGFFAGWSGKDIFEGYSESTVWGKVFAWLYVLFIMFLLYGFVLVSLERADSPGYFDDSEYTAWMCCEASKSP